MDATAVATTFYTAFGRRDADAMAVLYAEHAVFADPAFGQLSGRDAGDMWRMLCKGSPELRVSFAILEATPNTVVCRWIADYPFGPGKRPVHNVIVARISVENGQIVRHIDDFDFRTWARQALGAVAAWPGLHVIAQRLLGLGARKGLRDFQRRRLARG